MSLRTSLLEVASVEEFEEQFVPKDCGVWSKHYKPDTVLRPGRASRAEKKYRGNSSIPPRKDHKGKGKTLRDHRRVWHEFADLSFV
jgi:hypothetical protein